MSPTQKTDPGAYAAELAGTVADRYRIEAEIGRGAMARVYRARDLRYGTEVAFKLLRREFAESTTSKRFAREIKIASTLEHPNILQVLDSGDILKIPYYVMPLVDGETLEARLQREKRLGIADAVHLAGEIAAALSYAHAHGVVHRDVKPSNILLSHGHALVADFGIARVVDLVSDQLTDSGVTLGTAPYMSPEQGHTAAVDGRGDTYSLGIVLYEMLAGHPPFHGSSPERIIEQHATEPVPPLRTAREDVPFDIESAILRALAKTPEERWADPIDFKSAIDQVGEKQRPVSWWQSLRAKFAR